MPMPTSDDSPNDCDDDDKEKMEKLKFCAQGYRIINDLWDLNMAKPTAPSLWMAATNRRKRARIKNRVTTKKNRTTTRSNDFALRPGKKKFWFFIRM
jgi:hypothetical protein